MDKIVFDRSTWKHFAVRKKWVQGYFEMTSTKCVYESYVIYIYKEYLPLNNL